MKLNDFNGIVESTFEECKDVLLSKGKVRHNKRDDESLEQFYRIAHLRNCTLMDAVYRAGLDKHLTVLYKLVDDAEAGIFHDISVWNESIIDAINYLVILIATVWQTEENMGIKEANGELGSLPNESLRGCERELEMQVTSDRRSSCP